MILCLRPFGSSSFLKESEPRPDCPPSILKTAFAQANPIRPDFVAPCSPEMWAMETRPLGHVLRYLRQIAAPADGSQVDAELIERFVASHDGAAFSRLVPTHETGLAR
jgi:hypothetical protein